MQHWIKPLALSTALVFSTVASATLIDTGYEVGETTLVDDLTPQQQTVMGYEVDSIIAYAELNNSGDATEAGWMSAVFDELGIGIGAFDLDKIEFASDTDVDTFWTQIDGDVYNGEIDFEPAYYLIKIGGGLLEAEHFLYQNNGGLDDLTIDLGWMEEFSGFSGNNFDIYRISHVSTASQSVPEPGLMVLLGFGLLGFGISRGMRRRHQA